MSTGSFSSSGVLRPECLSSYGSSVSVYEQVSPAEIGLLLEYIAKLIKSRFFEKNFNLA